MPKAMLMDTDLCLDCNACTVECKRNNDVPVGEGVAWTKIDEIEIGAYPDVRIEFIKHACKHCTEPGCMAVCPVGAISKPDGVHVVVNQDWCIGCGYCVQACPFDIPHFGEPKSTMQKCEFCYGKRGDNESTACAAACPFGAIKFGERDELIQTGLQRISYLKLQGFNNANLYGVDEMGGLNVLYVLKDNPEAYHLPEKPRKATSTAWTQWLGGAVAAGLITIPFLWAFKRKKELAAGQKSDTGGN